MKYRVAAVVVFYNPLDEHFENIARYLDDVDCLFVVDNSEVPLGETARRLEGMAKVKYLANREHLGIARALNIGAEKALESGCDFLLTMDQDSRACPGMVPAMLACLDKIDVAAAGILSPGYLLFGAGSSVPSRSPCEELPVVITSGNLLSLSAYNVAGPFRDDYFIDYVDHEYCLRLRSCGYKIFQINNAYLEHQIGTITTHWYLYRKILLGNHSPIRRYYSFRNRFYFHEAYRWLFPEYFRRFWRDTFRDVLWVLLYESDKIDKLKMMYRGYRDYCEGIHGKYVDNRN
jgi:rhamnosyltransferase